MLALQTIIGRNVPAIQTAVLSVGHIVGRRSGSPNIIPSEVLVTGTARSYDPKISLLMERRMRELATSLAAAHGCTAEVAYDRRYPAAGHPCRADGGLRSPPPPRWWARTTSSPTPRR